MRPRPCLILVRTCPAAAEQPPARLGYTLDKQIIETEMYKHTMFPVTFFAVLLLLSGCGQTGELFLPEDPVTETAIDNGDEQQPEAEKNSQDDDSQDQP